MSNIATRVQEVPGTNVDFVSLAINPEGCSSEPYGEVYILRNIVNPDESQITVNIGLGETEYQYIEEFGFTYNLYLEGEEFLECSSNQYILEVFRLIKEENPPEEILELLNWSDDFQVEER